MAINRQKISQMTPKGADLDPTDLLEVSVDTGSGYETRSITGQEVIDGVGAVYVPYTGATQDVDLGEFELKAGQLTLDTTPTGTATVGTTQWNDSIGTSETTLKGGSVILKNGVDLVARVVNKVTPNAILTKANYTAVKISGAQGQRLAVGYAQANNDNNSADTIGVVIETIPTNQEGFIMTVGNLEDVNTTGSLQGETWADGDVLYLSPTTPGALTNVKPNGSTGHIVVMGYVEYAHAIHGKIYVKIMNGWELDELHNVYINPATLADNDLLQYDSATSLWKNEKLEIKLDTTPQLGGNLDVNGYQITSDNDQDVVINPNGVGIVKIESNLHLRDTAGGTAKQINLYEGFSNGSNYIGIKAPDSLSTDTTYTLPTADGTSGQVLSTNGTGTLSWATAGGGITVGTTAVTSGTDTRVFFQAGGVVQQDANFTFDNTLKRLTLKAGGATASDIPFVVRNSTDTYNILACYGNELTIIGRNESTEPRLIINRAGTTKMLLGGTADLNIQFPNSGYGQLNSGTQGWDIISTSGDIRTRNSSTYTLLKGNFFGIGQATPAARLDVRAQGALSTDIAFRVRNSADTADLISFRGDGSQWIQSVPFIHAGSLTGGTNAAQSLYVGYNSVSLATTGTRNTIIGTGTGTTPSGLNQTAIGHSVNTGGWSTAIAIGAGATLTSNNSCVMGSESYPFSAMSIGTGGTVTSAAAVQNMTFSVGGVANGFTSNTDLSSKFFRIQSQGGSGNGNGAPIQFSVAPSGASGFTANTFVIPFEVRGDAAGLNHYQLSTPRVPSASITDGYIQYSNDITAGNAAPHFRTENGNIIKLYRETTAVAAATFVANTSLIANDTATFDGYTIGQVVKALRNLGILA